MNVALSEFLTFIALVVIALFCAVLIGALHKRQTFTLRRARENPILKPVADHWWESEAIFNPAALYSDGRVHLLYRGLGKDGISRIGYASSADGINFDERLPYPVYTPLCIPRLDRTHKRPLSYDPFTYASGGGWGGAEDPRLVKIDEMVYMTFVAFDGWNFLRMALTSIGLDDFRNKNWKWKPSVMLSPPGETQKNWMLFPEKIQGKFAILHSISPHIRIEYVEDLNVFDGTKFIEGSARSGGRKDHWDKLVRGAGAPPVKTPYGWLLFYHGFDPAHATVAYKVGAMLLDLNDPTKVLYRSSHPILQAQEWYENDWKPGVTYASGTVVVGDDLLVYYGGGDKHIAVAKMNLEEFLKKLMTQENAE